MTTVANWLQDQPEFANQYVRARRIGIQLHIDGIVDLADSATDKNAHAIRLKVDVRKWLASKLLPKVYGEHWQLIEPPSDDSMPRRIDELQLARAIAYILYRATRRMDAQAPALPATKQLPAPAPEVEVEVEPE